MSGTAGLEAAELDVVVVKMEAAAGRLEATTLEAAAAAAAAGIEAAALKAIGTAPGTGEGLEGASGISETGAGLEAASELKPLIARCSTKLAGFVLNTRLAVSLEHQRSSVVDVALT